MELYILPLILYFVGFVWCVLTAYGIQRTTALILGFSPSPVSLSPESGFFSLAPPNCKEGQNSLSPVLKSTVRLRLPTEFMISCLKGVSAVSFILGQTRLVFWAWWMARPFSGQGPSPTSFLRASLVKDRPGRVPHLLEIYNHRNAASSRDIQMRPCEKWLKCRPELGREVRARAREQSSGGKMVRDRQEGFLRVGRKEQPQKVWIMRTWLWRESESSLGIFDLKTSSFYSH